MAIVRTSVVKRLHLLGAAAVAALAGSAASAAPLAIADSPVFLNSTNAQPLVMLALSNDEQLYHKAYTDFDDVDGDNVMDTTYKDTINYYGYFDSAKCYSYSGDTPTGLFAPAAAAAGTNGHACNTVTAGRWSGNFLNWATMSRMDALRKVLFGGYRSTDSGTSTVLERVHIPSDNHAWTKFYSAADLGNYTPYDIGTYGTGITMCNVTPPDASNDPSETTTTSPRLRVAKGQWTEWAAQESKQCLWTAATHATTGWEFDPNSANPTSTPNLTNGDKLDEFTVRVQACVSTLLGNEKCKAYGTSLKPVGLLQDFADADQNKIRFGLMTGSYGKRKSGGELRKNITTFGDEVNSADGTFTGSAGIVKSIDLMRISRYSYSDPGYGGADGCPSGQNSWSNGKCADWGNPVGEIFLESLRYFVAGTSANFYSDDTPWIANLTSPTWVNPYGTATTSAPFGGGGGVCAKPNVLAISTGVTSFDNDEYSKASDIPGLSTTALSAKTDAVGTNEGISGKQWYVGSLTGGSAGDICTSTTVSNLSNVTGICPEAAGLQGSFQVAGLAYYAHTHSMQTVSGKATPTVDTYAVSLAPPTPSLNIPVGTSTVTIIPAGYNKRDNNAMQLINFRVISQSADNSSGTYFMNFENAPAGSDYDNDMKGYLSYTVVSGNVNIGMWLTGSSAGATQWMGYTVSGVQDPGTYYLLSNTDSLTANDSTAKFFSQTQAQIDGACPALTAASYVTGTTTYCQYSVADTGGTVQSRYMRGIRAHTPGTSSTGLLKQPLWYAAKYGGFKDISGTGIPDTKATWDSNNDGVPDNYFFVTNASLLENQLSNAFNTILSHAGSASSASVNSGSISSTTRVFQAKFDTDAWGGQLLAFPIATDGTIGSQSWDASKKFPSTRNILTPNTSGALIPFQWTNLGAVSTGGTTTMQNLLSPDGVTATVAQNRLNYLRGDQTLEQSNSGPFRNRDSQLGDIVDSSPIYVAAPGFRYRDNMETVTYSSFRSSKASRKPVVYVGADDGMLHAFDASTNSDGTDTASAGQEVFGFIPSVVLPNLYSLTKPNYTHQYYEDGTPAVVDAFFSSDTAWHTVLASGLNKGGKEVFALDVTDPAAITEAASTNYLLWEFTNANDADLGFTYSRPAIVKMHDGKWAAIFGNGYDSAGTGHAVLFILDVRTGAVIKKIDTQVGSTGTPNGLATPAVVDVDGDGIVDYVYAGDLRGNMWKFDVTSSNESSWSIPYLDASSKPAPLFTANDGTASPGPYAQPITERPQVGFGPAGTGMIVLFGTGKFIEASDRTVDTANPRKQTFYGIFDPNTGASTDVVSGRSKLTQQTIVAEQAVTVTGTDSAGHPTSASYNVRVVSSNPVDLTATTGRGWYLDLVSPNGYEGEKSVSDPILRNGKIIFTTTIPDPDPCAYGGRSWLMEMDALTGSDLNYSPFDLNNDKKFNDQDLVTVTINGHDVQVPASGLQSTGGLITKPGVVSSQDAEYAISPDTSGTLEEHRQNPGPGAVGRQSWRQVH
ncbi:MAG TPA: PilC/PilY family type IV pilus protein [Steroidobacteraceae bacterium]|jgi:type IV pilus assembly protein PilY1